MGEKRERKSKRIEAETANDILTHPQWDGLG